DLSSKFEGLKPSHLKPQPLVMIQSDIKLSEVSKFDGSVSYLNIMLITVHLTELSPLRWKVR
ncbi:MAG: hypothetical protein LDL41_15235, partial [Coleofasciculus sp. S288]|nr:hypothetical protein [Coleofasciculus sp. S288]